MTPHFISISAAAFQTELLPGPSLSARQMKKLYNFTERNSSRAGKEYNLCPHIVSSSYVYTRLDMTQVHFQCRELNAVAKLANADSTFKQVHSPGKTNADHRPALALYPTHPQAVVAYTFSDEDAPKPTSTTAHKKHYARCEYQWMIAAVEIKKHDVECGFGFHPGEPLLPMEKDAVKLRSQFTTCAAEIMLRQHRTHVYMFYISGWHARAFRWDHNGAIVSHPIDLRTNCKQLLNLIYRLALANPEIQGFDTTVCLASQVEIEKLRLFTPSNTYLEEYKNMILDNRTEYPIFKVPISSYFTLRSLIARSLRSNVMRSSYLVIVEGHAPHGESGSSLASMLLAAMHR